MRILFCTQAESLRLFSGLRDVLAEGGAVERAGFTLADSWHYSKWLAENPGFERQEHLLLKEWDITRARHDIPDLRKLARYEREIGGAAGLFGAIVADRRLFMGKDCTYSQDYRRRLTDNELLCILQRGLEETEKLFDALHPDLLVSFICVTLLDYLAYLFAKARGVKVLNLRPTRVGDRVTIGSTLNDPSPEFVASYDRILVDGSAAMAAARDHVARVRNEHGRYEGVVRPSDKPALKLNTRGRSLAGRLRAVTANYLAYRRSGAASDNHVPDPLRAILFNGLINPWRARRARARLARLYVPNESLGGLRYAFYPLHTEPEVSLLVYGRPYVNQIEVIRWLAMSLPADMVLLVKEHPWMVGKRTLGAYRKMLDIPRVRLAEPKLEARTLIQGAELVAVITGSVALEAAILGKPVITFGDCPYNLLPDTMVRRCDDPRQLPSIIHQMLDRHATDEAALGAYVAAVMETSVSLNLYSVLLGKKGVYVERQSEYQDEIRKLADHVLAVTSEAASPAGTPAKAAAW